MKRWLTGILATLAAGGALAEEASPFALKLTTVAGAGSAEVRVAVTVPPGHVVYAEAFAVEAAPPAAAEAKTMPAAAQKPDPVMPEQTVQVFDAPFESLWRVAPCAAETRLTVRLQGCDATMCFMPEKHDFRFDAAAGAFVPLAAEGAGDSPAEPWAAGLTAVTGGGYMGVEAFLEFLDRAEGKAVSGGGAGLAGFLRDPVGFFRTYGVWLTLALVLAGGMLLNLTPCVLPMIPVNLAIIGAAGSGQGGGRARGAALGAAYGLGIVLVYGGLGWIILRSGLFFGALQASPWFSLAVAAVFAALALAMFDVFALDLTRFVRPHSGARGGMAAALAAGAVSALLAGACVAPVVLAVLLLAGTLHAGGARAAQFLPFVLGLGMALPWPLAGAGLGVLPKPGMWMVRVKQAFGVGLVALAAYYGWLAVTGFTAAETAHEGSILAGDRAAWSAKVAQARRESKPLFVDFWATWCKNCAAMERTTFEDERVKARLAGYVVVKVQAERPDKEPAKAMLAAFGVRGLPGFVVLPAETKPQSTP